jgi:hypothetical protein
MAPNTPRTASALNDGGRWCKIQAAAVIYLTIVAALNCRTWRLVRREREMRPQLWPRKLPSLASLKLSAQTIDPSLFAEDWPTEFAQDFKNPCWNTKQHSIEQQQGPQPASELHCLPAFYVLSGFQSGARDLAAKMQQHPDIAKTSTATPHFWSELRPLKQFLDTMSSAAPSVAQHPNTSLIGCVRVGMVSLRWSLMGRSGRWHTPKAGGPPCHTEVRLCVQRLVSEHVFRILGDAAKDSPGILPQQAGVLGSLQKGA